MIEKMEKIEEHAGNIVCLLGAIETLMFQNDDNQEMLCAITGIREYMNLSLREPLNKMIRELIDVSGS